MPQLTQCPNADALNRLMLGLVPESEARVLELHVADCPRCSAHIEQHQHEDDLVRAVKSRSPVLEGMQDEPLALIDRLQQLWLDRSWDNGDTAPAEYSYTKVLAVGGTTDGTAVRDFLDPPQTDDEIGRLGNYLVRRTLGRGGMGVVFLAVDTRLSRQVALKVLLDARYTDPLYLARFSREAESLARLQHPHIVRVYEVGQHRGRPFLALEYVEGGTLADQLADGSFAAANAARIVESLASAVQYAHSMGVVHRDLKPSNILLAGAERRPLISDFGLAKRLDSAELTLTGDVLGTPGYIAPELIRGDKSAGPTVDVYSLGAIFYELLAGRPPFRGATVLETLDQARSTDPAPARRLQSAVPGDLDTICLKCLQREPHQRYATAADLADDLARFRRGEPIRAKPISRLERLWKWMRREPALASLIAVSLLFIVAAAAGSLAHTVQLRGTLKQVEQERERADAGYLAARDTLDRIMTKLDARPVGAAPQLKELQRSLLEDTLRFYLGALERSSPDHPDVRYDTAVTCQRAATIELMLGRWDAASQHFQQTIELVAGLPPEQRSDPKVQVLLTACHNNMGLLANNHHQWEDAERHHLAAMEINEQMLQQQPSNAAYRNGIAESALNLAAVYQQSGRGTEAEPLLLRAVELRSALVAEFPNDERYRESLAHECENLAMQLQQDPSRVDEAVKRHKQAESLLLPLVEAHPPGGENALTLAAVYINWGYCLRAAEELDSALAKTSDAVDLAEAVLGQEPQHVTAHARTYQARGTRAQVLDHLGRHAEAIVDWDRVVELDTYPDSWLRRLDRAVSLARGGMTTRAVAEAEHLVADSSVSDEGLFNVACVYALTAEHCDQDSRLNADEQRMLAEHCAAQAVAVLKSLLDKGYFKDRTRAEALRTDEDLRVLRDREDFQQMIKELSL